jgi:hypothetical protein
MSALVRMMALGGSLTLGQPTLGSASDRVNRGQRLTRRD